MRKVASLLVLALVAGLSTAAPALAQAKPGVFKLSPTSGPPGRVLTISSDKDKCVPAGGAQNPHVLVQLYEQNKSALLAANNFPVNARGEWSGSLTVPATVPQGTKEVSAICRSGTGTPTQYKTYAVSQFLVTAPAFKFARLAGANRFETAATTAQNTFPTGAATAVIALGTNFPDALAGNYIAGERIAPILLVQPTTVPQGTLAGLRALKTQTVILLGGTAAISQGVEDQLKATDSTSSGSGKLSVTRIGGVNRYATARLVAESGGTAPVGSIDGKRTAIMGSGASFADVLAAGPLSYRLKLPTLLTEVTRLSAETRQALTNLQIAHVVIAGGTTVVTQAVENEIKAMGINVTRLAGTNRTDTAGRIAAYAVAKGGFVTTKANLARGDDYADALAGGPNAGNEGAVILLTAANNVLSPETRAYLVSQAGRITSGKIFGGTSAITNQVQAEAEAAATK